MPSSQPTDAIVLLKALADPGRLAIARLLLEGSFNVTELGQVLDRGQSTISRNLRILLDGGLLSSRREGREIFYSWARELQPAAAAMRPWVRDHAPILADDERSRVSEVWLERRERSERFFAEVDPKDPAAAWLGSADCLDILLEAVPEGCAVVDLGTGSGRLLGSLRDRADRVIGVDASASMLAEARRRVDERGIDSVDLRLGDLEHLPLEDGEVDTVVAHMVLHHLPEPARAFSPFHRVLRPGGQVLLGDFLPHQEEWMREAMADQWLGLSPDDVRGWLNDAGFQAIQIQTIQPQREGALGVFFARATRGVTTPPTTKTKEPNHALSTH